MFPYCLPAESSALRMHVLMVVNNGPVYIPLVAKETGIAIVHCSFTEEVGHGIFHEIFIDFLISYRLLVLSKPD